MPKAGFANGTHAYTSRWRGVNGRWEYSYATGVSVQPGVVVSRPANRFGRPKVSGSSKRFVSPKVAGAVQRNWFLGARKGR